MEDLMNLAQVSIALSVAFVWVFRYHNVITEFKQFGLSKDRTIYPFWLVVLVVGIIAYLCIVVKKDEYI